MAMIMDTTRRAWEPKGQGPSDGVAVRGLVNGRGPRRRRGKDSPVGAYRPDGPCPQATARRARACPSAPTPSGVTPASPRRDLQENEKGRYRSAGGARGAEGCFVRRGGRATRGGRAPGGHTGPSSGWFYRQSYEKADRIKRGLAFFDYICGITVTIFVGLLFLRCAIS